MNGAELAARYAFPPNSLRYCGRTTFAGALRSGKPRALEKELKKFKAHYGYLCLIAGENGLEPFDLRVVRAFWTGNALLDDVSAASLKRFFLRMFRNNPTRARKLAENIPVGSVPHHSFNPLYVNFFTDKVERSVRSYDSCCVTWGDVRSVSGKSAVVLRNSISGKAGRFVLVKKASRILLEKDGVRFIPKLKKGDTVSVHWGMAIERLTKAQSAALERYTRKNIAAMNAAAK
jgi:hydrogenase maturation factor